MRFPALLLLFVGCSHEAQEPLRLQATVAFPPKDTIRFELPAEAHRCADGRSLLLEAATPQGSAVLLLLRYRDSLVSGSYPIVGVGDTAAVPAAVAAVRYLLREVPHGFPLDSGSVQVERRDGRIDGRIEGSGLENAIRTPAHIAYRDVPIAVDTVSCRHQL